LLITREATGEPLYHDNFDAIIFGNSNYAPLAAYWQNAETSSTSAAERAFAKQVNDMQKFVLSHGEVELVWKNSTLLRAKDSAAFKQAIARLKTMPGKILPWILARAPGAHFWNKTCGTISICWSIPW
jgi:hypothetical protein